MKNVEVVKAIEVDIKPFLLNDFINKLNKKAIVDTVSKKELKSLAKKNNIKYNDEQIQFAKDIIAAYLVQR